MFGRTEDIIEMQEGNLVDDPDMACSIENMDDDNMPFTTLISKFFYNFFGDECFIKRLLFRCRSS